jgi:hypothetical protein
VRARVRVGGIRDGVIFLPFHYGYWDTSGGFAPEGSPRAANELTPTDWDPVSKQPLFKTGAAKLTRVEAAAGSASGPTTAASRPAAADVAPTRGGPIARVEELLSKGM